MSRSKRDKTFVDSLPPFLQSCVDTGVSPEADFYDFACGSWCKSHPIPNDRASYGHFDELSERTLNQLYELMKECKSADGSIAQKISDLFALYSDEDSRNRNGLDPLQFLFDEIAGIGTKNDLSSAMGKSLDYGLVELYVSPDDKDSNMNILHTAQSGFFLGERGYYIDKDDHSLYIRGEYKKHVSKMFSLCGFADNDHYASEILRLETRFAQASRSSSELRDPQRNYNKMNIDELNNFVPSIDWEEFFRVKGISPHVINVCQPEYLQEVQQVLVEEDLQTLKIFFLWQVIMSYSSFLTRSLYEERFHFWGTILSGVQTPSPMWKRATRFVNGILGEAVGQMYVKRYFSPTHRAKALSLVNRIRAAFRQRITNVDWMSDETKNRALEKLSAMSLKIGFPDKWRDYSGLEIDSTKDIVKNVVRVSEFEEAYEMSFLERPVDRTLWLTYPQTVNAYYSPLDNEICLPAGILQPPFFDISVPDAVNFGAIGTIIGHEMTHGFDDEGRQFDKNGNLLSWWSVEDEKRFTEHVTSLKQYFDTIVVGPGLTNDGSMTIGENIADQGGVITARDALAKLLKERRLTLKEQQEALKLFYLSFASIWAENMTDEELKLSIKSDYHSIPRWRVLGTLAHIDEWYDLWNIGSVALNYLPKEKRILIW